MKKFIATVASALFALTFLFTGCGAKTDVVKISGSTSVEPLMKALIGKYIELSGVNNDQFEIVGSGSGAGIGDATDGTVDFGMSSRELKANEKSNLDEMVLAKDGIAVIMHNETTLKVDYTLAEIKTIFTTGELDGNSYFTIARESGSGTRSAFEDIVELAKSGITFGQEFSSTSLVLTAVAERTEKDAIGYISLGSLNDTVQAVKVGGYVPTASNVVSGNYALSRPFLIVEKKGAELSSLAKDFKKFLTSKQAQEIIEDKGYVSIVESPALYKKS